MACTPATRGARSENSTAPHNLRKKNARRDGCNPAARPRLFCRAVRPTITILRLKIGIRENATEIERGGNLAVGAGHGCHYFHIKASQVFPRLQPEPASWRDPPPPENSAKPSRSTWPNVAEAVGRGARTGGFLPRKVHATPPAQPTPDSANNYFNPSL